VCVSFKKKLFRVVFSIPSMVGTYSDLFRSGVVLHSRTSPTEMDGVWDTAELRRGSGAAQGGTAEPVTPAEQGAAKITGPAGFFVTKAKLDYQRAIFFNVFFFKREVRK